MKTVNATNGVLRKGIDASDAALTKENSAILKKAFAVFLLVLAVKLITAL